MRKIYILAIIYLLGIQAGWTQSYSGGSGTQLDPYQIVTPQDLDNVRLNTGAWFIQMADIDLSGYSNWDPIGTAGDANRFFGHYDGDGYKILNLTINRPSEDNVGLFGEVGPNNPPNYTNSVDIRNLGLENVDIQGQNGVGSLVGRVFGNENTIISACYVTRGTVTGQSSVGGLVGINSSYITNDPGLDGRRPRVIRSYANVSVSYSGSNPVNSRFGGLVGDNRKGSIENSYAIGSVNISLGGSQSVNSVGGLTGFAGELGLITNSFAASVININAQNQSLIGGLVGSLGATNQGTVSSSYWDINVSGQSGSAGGEGRTSAQMKSQSNYSGWNFSSTGSWDIIEGVTYPFLRAFDLSGFEISDPGIQIAGVAFNLLIGNALDVNGNFLNNNFRVTVKSNIPTEGPSEDGILFDQVVSFSTGNATLSNIVLKFNTLHEIEVEIETILNPGEISVQVNPAPANQLFLVSQPQNVNGNYDNEPVGLTIIAVETRDEFGNPSNVGLSQVQNITVSIANDASAQQDASLGGTTTLDIQSGSATFNNLTLDRQGEGFTLLFTSQNPVALLPATSDPFNVTELDDLSEFTLINPGSPQYENVDFDLAITNARSQTGVLINGAFNIIVVSSIEGTIFNSTAVFTAGNATITISLAEIEVHDLTVTVAGISDSQTLTGLVVDKDRSGFSIINPGNQFSESPFDLTLIQATGLNGSPLNGSYNVIVSSNQDGEVFNALSSFGNGSTFINIELFTVGFHDLTVSIQGITQPMVLENLNILANLSGFQLAIEPPGNKFAGEPFQVNIFNVRAVNNAFVTGFFNVTITSNFEGELFTEEVYFLNGDVQTLPGVTLFEAALHTLNVAIETITPEETIDVNVLPGEVTGLMVTTQPTGGTGFNDNTPVGIGNVVIQAIDNHGNPTTVGLDIPHNISVEIGFDASVNPGAILGGTLTRDLSSGTATFDNLTLDRDGVGYTLLFTTIIDGDDFQIESAPFNMTNVENQAGFDIVDPGPQVVNVGFNLQLINGSDEQGNLLQGNFSVVVQRMTPFAIFYNQQVQFVDGQAMVPITISNVGGSTLLVIVDNTLTETILINVVASDNSTFAFSLVPDEDPTAGNSFDVAILNARDKAGNLLTGSRIVTLTTNNLNEGAAGLLYNGPLVFAGGVATINDITLFRAGPQDLTASIDWVTNPVTESIVVNPGLAEEFVITQQPAGGFGVYNNDPVEIGDVILQFRDAWGNLSSVGLSGNLTVTASIESGPAANLGGTLEQAISSSFVVFDDLTLDRNGLYTLAFTFNGLPSLTFQVSDEFEMTNIEDLSGFTVDDPGKQYENLPFNLFIINARDITGTTLSGSLNVTVNSDQAGDGEVFNQEVVFIDGEASVPVTLTVIGFHNLTIEVQNVTLAVILENLEVAEDESGFDLSLDPPSGPFYQNNPFNLILSNATNLEGVLLDGEFGVIVISDLADGEVYNNLSIFTGGILTLPINLATEGLHELTVSVVGITNNEAIVVDVRLNQSGFQLALDEPGDKTAGVDFDLVIFDALDFEGISLDSEYQVTVTSNLSGEEFNALSEFVNGGSSLTLNLTLAGNHTLTVSVASITGTRDIQVNVVAAEVAKIRITTQPAGGTGTGDDTPASIGTVVIQTSDEFDNLSVVGLSGLQTVTASLGNDASAAGNAQLDGNLTLSILDGIAVFDDLTLNKEGNGFTLIFTYSGTPDLALAPVESDPFNMVNINLYAITLDVTDPLVFPTEVVGYTPLTPETITISRLGGGVIQNLQFSLTGNNAGDFVAGALSSTTLLLETDEATFTIVPEDDLPVGYYTATVLVSADNDVSEQFDVIFRVLAEYAISLDADDPTVFATVTEGYSQIADITVTITNTGALEITGLNVNLTGANPLDFVVSQVSPESILYEETAVFTIRPENDLAPGIYSALVTVDNNQDVTQSFTVNFEVLAYTYLISLEPAGPIDFGIRAEGYTPLTPVVVTITREGTGPITNLEVGLSGTNGDDFLLGALTDVTLDEVTPEATFTIKPEDFLGIGTYTAVVTVTADNSIVESFNVSFRVVNEVIWLGLTSSWHTETNWSSGVVPNQDVYIRIPSSSNDPVVTLANITVNNLVIENGAELSVSGSRRITIRNTGKLTVNPGGRLTVSGTLINNAGTDGLVIESNASATGSIIHGSSGVQATVERWMSGRQFHVVSPPVGGQSIQSFLTANPVSFNATQLFWAVQHYNENGGWSAYYPATVGGNFETGRAYSMRLGPSAGAAVSFKGELLQGTLNKNLTRTSFGWNGLGNPYASSMGVTEAAQVTGFLNANASQLDPEYSGVYIFDPVLNGYRIINNMPQEQGLVQDYISVAQGFIIKSKPGGGTATFSPAMRSHQQTTFFKSLPASSWYSLRLGASTQDKSSSTFIGFNSSMTNGLDVTYDAGLFESDPNFGLYSKMLSGESDVRLMVQALPDFGFEKMSIPIGLQIPAGGEVKFSLKSLQLPENAVVMLEDKKNNVVTNLESEHYIATIDAGENTAGRFYLNMFEYKFFPVLFGIDHEGWGGISVKVDGEAIESGKTVLQGKTLEFLAWSNTGYEFSHWMVNGVVQDETAGEEMVIEDLQSDLEVIAVFTEITSVEDEILIDGMRIYTQNRRIYIEGPVTRNSNAILYDMLGRRMLSVALDESESQSFSTHGLIKGIYILEITDEKTNLKRKLFIE